MLNERLDIELDRFVHGIILEIRTCYVQVNRHPSILLSLHVMCLRHLGQETLLPIVRAL
jgi:hypothetical protein